MALRLLGEARPLELCFWWETGKLPERLSLRDEVEARSFLARLSSHGHTPALRRLIDPPPMRAEDDAVVLDRLASWIASGRLHVRTGPAPALASFYAEVEEEPLGERVVRPAPVVDEAPAPVEEEALPPEGVDDVLQALVLRRAAEKGIPFCEECERKKQTAAEDDTARLEQAAMARTLVLAAQEGVPFCEECERGKVQDERPPPDHDEDDEDDEDEDEDEDGETSSEPRGEEP